MNYVLLGTKDDYFSIMFRDLFELDNIQYLSDPFENIDYFHKIIRHLVYKNTLGIRNCRIARMILFKYVCKKIKFKASDNICLICFGHNYSLYFFDFFNKFKKKYKRSSCVFYFEDNIDRFLSWYSELNLETIRSTFDCVISYNRIDAKKYGFHFYPLCYSKPKEYAESKTKEWDVSFAGSAKGRLSKIIKTYDCLSSKGLRCKFNVIGVKDSEIIPRDGIVYNKKLNYKEILNEISKSKAVLEIIQDNFEGFTLRVLESIYLNKYLITDNTYLKEELCDLSNVFFLCDYNLCEDEIKTIRDNNPLEKQDNNNYSAISFLNEIDTILTGGLKR